MKLQSTGSAGAVKQPAEKQRQRADVIFAMEDKHRQQLQSRFPREMAYADIHVLDIPDEYQFMDPELVQCIEDTVGELLAD